MGSTKVNKGILLIEIIICFFLMLVFDSVFSGIAGILKTDGLWVGIMAYFASATAIIVNVTKVKKKTAAYVGLKMPLFIDIPKGLVLGLCMFIMQQIPLLLMKMDYTALAAEPDWSNIIIMSLYCFLCVGFVEELIFRGFILQKTQELCKSKVAAILVNCLAFYAFHWPPVRFIFGEFFNTTLNTLLLCLYLYESKNKSIVPLMIAHGFYDILSAYLLPAFLFYIG